MKKTTHCSSMPLLAVCAAALGAGLPTSAFAQAPDGLLEREQATSGETNIAAEGFQKVAMAPEESKDAQSFVITLGGLLTAGNARTMAFTGAGNYRLRRGASQLTAQAAANFGQSYIDDGYERTVENYQGRLRYDYFFSEDFAAFFSVTGRQDAFQGLDLRLNIDPGLAYYAISNQQTLLWGELGYDLQHDIRCEPSGEDSTCVNTDPTIEKTETRHSVRGFVGYDRKISDTTAFDASVEYIQAMQKTVNWRLNGGAGLTTQLAESLSVATTITVKYDNNPLVDVKRTDLVTAFNLVYQLPDDF